MLGLHCWYNILKRLQYQAAPTKNCTKETKCLEYFIQQHRGRITPPINQTNQVSIAFDLTGIFQKDQAALQTCILKGGLSAQGFKTG